MHLTLFDRWALDFEDGSEKGWFLEYVLRSPKQAGHHLTAGRLCYEALADTGLEPDSAFEVFGGIGGQSLIVEDLFAPMVHIVNEYAPQAVEALEANLGSDMAVSHEDAYEGPFDPQADLITLDFGDLTAWKAANSSDHRVLLQKAFDARPKAVLVTDIACRYLHLHRERYEKLLGLGTCASYDTYIEAFAHSLEDLFGYELLVGYKDSWSTVMAFVPRARRPLGFRPTPHLADVIRIG